MSDKIKITDYFSAHINGEHRTALIAILNDVMTACKKIAIAIDSGALEGTMHNLASENVQGEVQKALDVITNEIFIESTQGSGYVVGMASEEMEDIIQIDEEASPNGQYLLLFDPLDGSSNVNVNISVGTIFSILKAPVQPQYWQISYNPAHSKSVLVMPLYGTSTMLVLTTGNGTHGFTLDNELGEFYLTHAHMQVPEDTQEFAINMSNYRFWQAPIQRYIDECLQGEEGDREKDFNMRWVASMVAEVHRILVRGGVFMYPIDSKIKKQGGKLRLLYEANPMSFIMEQAGGLSTSGHMRILDIVPNALHQRIPVMMGSKHEIERIVAYHGKTKR